MSDEPKGLRATVNVPPVESLPWDARTRRTAWELGHELHRDDWTSLSCVHCGLKVTAETTDAAITERGRCPKHPTP